MKQLILLKKKENSFTALLCNVNQAEESYESPAVKAGFCDSVIGGFFTKMDEVGTAELCDDGDVLLTLDLDHLNKLTRETKRKDHEGEIS